MLAAEEGAIFGCIPDVSPDVCINDATGEIHIVSLPEDENGELVIPDGWCHLTDFITDAHTYTIIDHQHFLDNGGAVSFEDGRKAPEVVEVPAGVYEFTHHHDVEDAEDLLSYDEETDSTPMVVFATGRRIS